MRRTHFATVAVLCLWAAFRAEAVVSIREIRLTLDRTSYTGPCPVRIPAHIVFVPVVPVVSIEDDWGWNFDRLMPHSFEVAGGHLRPSARETAVEAVLTLPPPRPGVSSYEGPVSVGLVENPTVSPGVRVSVHCTTTVKIDAKLVQPVVPRPTIPVPGGPPKIPPPAGGGAGPVVRLPDLVPDLSHPPANPWGGVFVVKNIGDGPSAPCSILLRCRAVSGGTGSKGGCPDVPGIAPLYDPALDSIVMPLPGIAAGGSHTFTVPGFAKVKWPAGTYKLFVRADALSAVHERREDNNTAEVSTTR